MKKKPAVPTEAGEKIKLTSKDKIRAIIKKAPKSKFLTASQETYWEVLDQNEITICTGPAGTGKSYVAMKKAIDLLFGDNKFEKIIIVRPAVESGGKSLGSLPGNLDEKMDAYIAPFFYILEKIIGKDATGMLREIGAIQVLPISYARGWSIDNAILILEEAQNCDKGDMKMLLTRIGFNSKYFISGDIEQTDAFKDITKSGLYDAKHRLQGLKGIGMHEFSIDDIVRNSLISAILKRYTD